LVTSATARRPSSHLASTSAAQPSCGAKPSHPAPSADHQSRSHASQAAPAALHRRIMIRQPKFNRTGSVLVNTSHRPRYFAKEPLGLFKINHHSS
jgi:hypothetical protein